VYVDRAHVLALLATHPVFSALGPRLSTDPQGEVGRSTVLVLHGLTGQITFHLADEDLDLLEHVPWAAEDDPLAVWDGHTKDMARSRMANLVQLLCTEAGR
jgi:hypothetical protein